MITYESAKERAEDIHTRVRELNAAIDRARKLGLDVSPSVNEEHKDGPINVFIRFITSL